MSKYKVILYLASVPVVATINETPDGEPLLFDTLADAETYGQSKGVVFEPVEVEL